MTASQKDFTTQAYLVSKEGEIAIEATYASRFSVQVSLPNGTDVQDGSTFENLAVMLDGERVDLGPCRFVKGASDGATNGSLLFTKEIYDYDELFFRRRKAVLQSDFANLPMLLAHQNEIRQSFKDFTGDLTYSLNVYRGIFDAMDADLEMEPALVREGVQRVVLANEGAEFLEFFDEQVTALEHSVSDFNGDEQSRHGYYFRRQMWPFILQSALMYRTNLKPRGYSGDSEIMRMLYLQEDLGDSIFAKLMHIHPVASPAAQAVRDRCKTVAEMLRAAGERSNRIQSEPLKVLSVACGPAYEMNLLLQTPEDCARYAFTLLDQDTLALAEVAAQVAEIEGRLGAEIKVEYLPVSVRTMMSPRRLASRWEQYDFIYSLGLIDYLTAPVATALLTNLYGMLASGGEMVIGNCHVWNPRRIYMEYWGDWVLYYRTEEEFLDLLRDVPDGEKSVRLDGLNIQMFLKTNKRG